MLKKLIGRAGGVAIGIAAGQALVLLVTPYLARRYAPEDFGLLALLTTVANVSTAAACLRYDLAMPSSPRRELRGLLTLSISLALGIGLATGLLVVVLGNCAWARSAQGLLDHPVMMGCCVALVGCYQATAAWLLHRGAFGGVSALRFSQGALFSLFALIPWGNLGWALVASFAGGLFAFSKIVQRGEMGEASRKEVGHRHRQFPLLSLPGSLLDVCGFSLCIWVIDVFYGHAVTGNYAQIQRLIGAPLMLLSMSLGQVLLKQTAEVACDRRELRCFVIRVLQILAGLTGGGLIVVWLCGEPLLRLFLGDQWSVDRDYVTLVAVAVFVRACVSPLSTVLITLRRFRLALVWQAAYFCSAAVLFAWVASCCAFSRFLWFYAFHEVVFYGIYLFLILRALDVASGTNSPSEEACDRPALNVA